MLYLVNVEMYTSMLPQWASRPRIGEPVIVVNVNYESGIADILSADSFQYTVDVEALEFAAIVDEEIARILGSQYKNVININLKNIALLIERFGYFIEIADYWDELQHHYFEKHPELTPPRQYNEQVKGE